VSLASLPALLLAGRIAHTRRLVAVSMFGFAVAGTLPGLARSPLVLFLLLLLVGSVTGLLDVAINARASTLETGLGIRVMDGLHAGFSGGVLVGGIGAGLLRRGGAPPWAILLGVSCVILVAGIGNLRPEQLPAPPPRRSRLERRLIVIGLVLAVGFLLENGLESWSALFLERGLGSGPGVSGLGPGLFAGSMLVGRVAAQRVRRASVSGRMTFAGIAAAAGLALAATATHPAVALVGFVVAGGGLALSAPTLFGAAGRLGGGAAISSVAALGYLGFLAGPPLIGAVAGATSLRGGFLFLCGTGVLLAACAPTLRRAGAESHP